MLRMSTTEVGTPRNDDEETATSDVQPAEVAPPQTYPTGVVINEILPSPEGADEEFEWIELYNTNNFEIDLSGWKIKDREGATTDFILSENTKISAYGYLVLKRPNTKITLNNTIDGITLFCPNEKIIDSITYEKAPTGQSYNKTSSGWAWSISLTPGAKNVIAQNDIGQGTENLPKIEKSGNKENEKGLATISQSIEENTNPWFLFLTAIIITIIFATIFLILKIRIKP